MSEPRRGSWYLLTGLIIGLIAGLVYAWQVQPVQYFDTSPAALRQPDKDQYRVAIALAYLSNRDLVRASARLELLGDKDSYLTLTEQAQRTLAQGNMAEEARALGQLALDLGQARQTPGSPEANPTPPVPENPATATSPVTP